MSDLFMLLGMQQNLSTAYHPQTDEQTEHVNQEIKQYLRIFINHRQSDWSEWLSLAEFSYNDKVHMSTGHLPFYLNSGQHPWKGIEPRALDKSQSASEFVTKMTNIRKEAKASLIASAETMKRFYDKHTRPARNYKTGDLVYLEG